MIKSAQVVVADNSKKSVEEMMKSVDGDYAINGSFFWTSADVKWRNIPINTVVSNGKVHNVSIDFSRYGIAVRDESTITLEKFDESDKSIQNFLGGSPTLIVNGKAFNDHRVDGDQVRHPRSIIGLDDNHLYLITIDGRVSGTKGATLKEVTDKLLSLGLTQAINLDGGGSSVLESKQGRLNKTKETRLIPDCFVVNLEKGE